MKKELNELANQLQVLAAKFEEIATPTPINQTAPWKEFCDRVYHDTDSRIDIRGEEPLTALHILYMHVPDMRFTEVPRREDLPEPRPFEDALRDTNPAEVRLWNPRFDANEILTLGTANTVTAHQAMTFAQTRDQQERHAIMREIEEDVRQRTQFGDIELDEDGPF